MDQVPRQQIVNQLSLPQEVMTRMKIARVRVRRRLVHHWQVHRVILARPGLYLIGPQRCQLVDVGVASAAATEMLVHHLLLMKVHLSSLYHKLFVPLTMLLPTPTLHVHTPPQTTTQQMMMTIVSTAHCNWRRRCR